MARIEMTVTAIGSPLVAGPAPGPMPTPADKEPRAGTAAHPFAEMLRQNRLAEAPPAAEASKASTPAEGNDRPAATNRDDGAEPAAPGTPSSRRDATPGKARFGGAPHAAARSTAPTARSTGAAECASGTKDESATASTPASTDALVPPGTASVSRPEFAQGSDAIAGNRVGATIPDARGGNDTAHSLDAANDAQAPGVIALDAPATGTTVSGAAESSRGTPAAATDAAAEDKAMPSRSDERASASPSFAETLTETRAQQQHSAASTLEVRSHGAAGSVATPTEPTGSVVQGTDAAVATSSVPVPVDSPDFAAAFGLQVSTLARDGVQRAELHLNPTDMGPVSIQITLDGTQARVDFGADVAATRHAIETGLPELASALRDAGFTLAGGGVTQHSHSNGRQADDAGSGNPGPRRSTPEAIIKLDTAAQRVARRVAAGGVDLYA